MKLSDKTGYKFGKLRVIKRAVINKHGKPAWSCICDCGNTIEVASYLLTSGKTQSCGCLKKELLTERSTTHGASYTDEFIIWQGVKSRCLNKRNKRYHGRGITFCDAWNDFAVFLKDMGKRPSVKHSIDRIDNDKNYCPENCRWATIKEQMNNTSQNINLSFNGETMTATQWEEKLNLPKGLVRQRVTALKWSVEKALTRPIGRWIK